MILGAVLDRYQNYKRMVQILCVASLITSFLHYGTLPSGNGLLEISAMFIIGLTVIPIASVGFTFAVELAFPVPESLTNGIMITFCSLYGTAAGFLCSMLAEHSTYYPMIFWSGSALLALLISFFIEQDLRRLKLEDVKTSEYIEEEDVRK